MRVLVQTAVLTAAAAMALPSLAGTWTDSFTDPGLDDWEIYNFHPDVESWTERQEGQNGVVTGWIETDGSLSILELKPPGHDVSKWKNYTMKVRCRMDSEPKEGVTSLFGITLYSNIAQSLGHDFWIYPHSNVARLWIDGADNLGLYHHIGVFDPGVWYALTATVETIDDRDRVSIQIDDRDPIVAGWGASIGSGGIGFIVYNGEASFDDFEISGDSIPNGTGDRKLSVDPKQKSAQIWGNLKSR